LISRIVSLPGLNDPGRIASTEMSSAPEQMPQQPQKYPLGLFN
jgi:hypothetical protein